MNLFPCPIATEPPVVIMHGRPRWKVMWQHSPRTASSHQIQDAIDHISYIRAPRPSTRFYFWKQWLNQLPLLICQISWVRYSVHNLVIGQNTTFHTRSKASCSLTPAAGLGEIIPIRIISRLVIIDISARRPQNKVFIRASFHNFIERVNKNTLSADVASVFFTHRTKVSISFPSHRPRKKAELCSTYSLIWPFQIRVRTASSFPVGQTSPCLMKHNYPGCLHS